MEVPKKLTGNLDKTLLLQPGEELYIHFFITDFGSPKPPGNKVDSTFTPNRVAQSLPEADFVATYSPQFREAFGVLRTATDIVRLLNVLSDDKEGLKLIAGRYEDDIQEATKGKPKEVKDRYKMDKLESLRRLSFYGGKQLVFLKDIRHVPGLEEAAKAEGKTVKDLLSTVPDHV